MKITPEPWHGSELADALINLGKPGAFPMLRKADCFQCRGQVVMKAIRAMKYPWAEYECENGHRRDQSMTRRDHAEVAEKLERRKEVADGN